MRCEQGISMRSRLQLVGQAPGSASTQVPLRPGFSAGLDWITDAIVGAIFPCILFTWHRARYSKPQAWHWCNGPFLCPTSLPGRTPSPHLRKYQGPCLSQSLQLTAQWRIDKSRSVMLLYNKSREIRRAWDFCLWSLAAAG